MQSPGTLKSLICKKFILVALCLFFNKALAKSDVEGSFLIRSSWPKTQRQSLHSFLTYSQFYLHGRFYSSNELKSQVHLIFSDFYGDSDPLLVSPVRIYPSVNWLIHESLELRLGRNTYENKFHQIVSLNVYEPFFYTFDGAFLEYSANILNVNFWMAHLPARWIKLQQIKEFKYGFGLFLDMESLSDYIDFFNFHVAYLADSFTQKSEDKMSRYGLALEGTISPINLGYNFIAVGHGQGIQFKLEEKMYHFYISYSHPGLLNSEIFIGYHKDSASYNPWLYNRHEHAGLLDMFLWGNLTYNFLGVESSWRKKFDLQLVFHNLSSTDKGFIEMGYFGSLINTEGEKFLLSSATNLGKELDISIRTQLKEDFEVKLLAGLFIPSSKTKNFFKQGYFYNNIQLSGFYKF